MEKWENIKVGETYYFRVKVKEKEDISGKVVTISPGGEELLTHYFFRSETSAFSHINPYPPLNLPKMTEIPETYPKYDPRRLFRKGDKVRLCEYNGRAPFDNENFEQEEAGQLCIIAENEDYENAYSLHVWKLEDMEREPDDGERPWFAFPLMFMELVTPVEELEPYTVEEGKASFLLKKGDKLLANYWPSHPNAKAAAEAERDRLNAEWRKELEK